MNTKLPPTLIALVGGSGAGKSWLAARLCEELGDEATSLSLDDFYCDLSHLSLSDREKVNFDHPDSIDWALFEVVLRELQQGVTVWVPRYNFSSHVRLAAQERCSPRPFLFVEGLWVLWHPHVRELFNLRIFLDCVQSLRWQRRLARDIKDRSRTQHSIRKQFWNVVAPMHQRFVEVQKDWADLVIGRSITQPELGRLVSTIRTLRVEPGSTRQVIIGPRTPPPTVPASQTL